MFKKSVFILLTLIISVSFWGCARVPQQEINNAMASLEAAKSVEANRYLETEFNALQDSFNVAMTDIEAQKSKSVMSKNFKNAKAMLILIAQNGDSLKAKTLIYKAEVQADVDQKINVYKELVEKTQVLLTTAPKGKESRAVVESMKNDLNAIETTFAEVANFMQEGDYLSAQERVDSSIEKVQVINDELQQAINKKGLKK